MLQICNLTYKLMLLSCLHVAHHIALRNFLSCFQMTIVLGAYASLGNDNNLTTLHCNSMLVFTGSNTQSVKALRALRALRPLRTITRFDSLRAIVVCFLEVRKLPFGH